MHAILFSIKKNYEYYITPYEPILRITHTNILLHFHTPICTLHALISVLTVSLHLSPLPPLLTHPCARPLTRDKPCPCPPLTPAEEEKEGGEGPSAPQKPEWLRAAHIHWGNKRSLCQEGRVGGSERGRAAERERYEHYIGLHTIYNVL